MVAWTSSLTTTPSCPRCGGSSWVQDVSRTMITVTLCNCPCTTVFYSTNEREIDAEVFSSMAEKLKALRKKHPRFVKNKTPNNPAATLRRIKGKW